MGTESTTIAGDPIRTIAELIRSNLDSVDATRWWWPWAWSLWKPAIGPWRRG